jgi:hypothetical protein
LNGIRKHHPRVRENKPFYALDRAATVIGVEINSKAKKKKKNIRFWLPNFKKAISY